MNLETEGKISQAVPNFLKHYYFRSSHLRLSVKKGALTNFVKFAGKHLCQKFWPATLLKKCLWYRCFSVNFAKFLRRPFLQDTSGPLLLLFPHKKAYSSNNSHNAYKNAYGNSKFMLVHKLNSRKLTF